MQKNIEITHGIARHPLFRLAGPLDFELKAGEHLAVWGANGSGKSLFVNLLTGAHPLLDDGRQRRHVAGCIRHIVFRNVYGTIPPAYYQQRWNHADETYFPTVGEVLGKAEDVAEEKAPGMYADLFRLSGMDQHTGKTINLLSSGEMRRLQLLKALKDWPQTLIIDNPYIGLDAETRAYFTEWLTALSKHITIVLVVNRKEDIPPFIRQVVQLENRKVGSKIPRNDFFDAVPDNAPAVAGNFNFPPPLHKFIHSEEQDIICFRDVTVRYGARTILKNFNWKVCRGEHWALTGQNGAGKSTLLSLVCADNPVGYACDISLFGKRRGSGESIWDIKQKIGYVSPEMAMTYNAALKAVDIVASGLRDTIGLYGRRNAAEEERCVAWMEIFGIAHLAQRDYRSLSTGEQQLVLLTRAFVKTPQLLILDEPFHGLDARCCRRAMQVIDEYMANPAHTLIMVSHYDYEYPACIDRRIRLQKQE